MGIIIYVGFANLIICALISYLIGPFVNRLGLKLRILDIGIGNVMSLYSVIQRLNIKVKICKSKNDLDEVKKIICHKGFANFLSILTLSKIN